MSAISNEKKWKYLSFALMGILGTGVFATQAFGTSPSLTDAMNKLLGLDTKITAIKAKTDSLPANPASQPKSLAFDFQENLTPPSGGLNRAQLSLIESEEGKTFSGHATIVKLTETNVDFRLICNLPNGGNVIFDQTGFGPSPNTDFACNSLVAIVTNFDTVDHFVYVSGVVQYQETTDVSTTIPNVSS